MICCNIETKLRYNYRFIPENIVEIWDGEDYTKEIPYSDWCKEYYIIDKWRCLSPEEMEYNKELWKAYMLET